MSANDDLERQIKKVDKFYAGEVKKLDDFYGAQVDKLLEKIQGLESALAVLSARVVTLEKKR